jgi:CHASE3 domain sensor protein
MIKGSLDQNQVEESAAVAKGEQITDDFKFGVADYEEAEAAKEECKDYIDKIQEMIDEANDHEAGNNEIAAEAALKASQAAGTLHSMMEGARQMHMLVDGLKQNVDSYDENCNGNIESAEKLVEEGQMILDTAEDQAGNLDELLKREQEI